MKKTISILLTLILIMGLAGTTFAANANSMMPPVTNDFAVNSYNESNDETQRTDLVGENAIRQGNFIVADGVYLDIYDGLANEVNAVLDDYLRETYGMILPDNYAGVYIDEYLNLIVCVTDNHAKTEYREVLSDTVIAEKKQEAMQSIKASDHHDVVVRSADTGEVASQTALENAYEAKQVVSYRTVPFSLNELNALYDLLADQFEELGMFQLARYEQFNCVTASVDTDEQRAAVLIAVPEKWQEALKVEVGGKHPTLAATEDIEGGNRILNNTSGGVGTVGFNAYNYATAKYGVATCNHVTGLTDKSSKWIQYGSRANLQIPLNNHSVTNKNNVCVALDAAFDPFNNTTSVTWATSNKLRTQYGKDNGSSYCTVTGIIANSSFVVGTPVTKIGYTTNWQYGTITSTSSTAGSVAGGGFQTNHYVQPGDSGGPIFYCTASNDLLAGITCAKSSDYVTWAVKIKPLMFALSLDLVGSAKQYRVGDVNGDGVVNATDATWVTQAVNGTRTLTGNQWEAADVDMSKTITSADATKITTKVNGGNPW